MSHDRASELTPSDRPPSQRAPSVAEGVTVLLTRAEAGDRAAADQLLPLVYAQLRAAAQQAMRTESPRHTLTATALVHEAYLRLLGPQGQHSDHAARSVPQFAGRGHFYAAAAQAMRQHLIDHARAKLAVKRGGAGRDGDREAPHLPTVPRRVPVEHLREVADLAMIEEPEQIVSLDAALCRLESEDPHTAAVVRLRFFAGLTIEQTAEALGISPATVKRDWQFARAWLFKALKSGGEQ